MDIQSMGKVSEPNDLFAFCTLYGTAKNDEHDFDLLVSPNGHPMVQCKQSGRTFVLDWQAILALAVERGVTHP